jgi:putative drug exporter of the RND superfamily
VFAAIGRFAYRRRRPIVAVWVLLFAAGVWGDVHVAGVLKGGGFTSPTDPSEKTLTLAWQRLKAGLSTVTVVFTSDSLQVKSPEFQRLQTKALSRMTRANVPYLTAIEQYSLSQDPELISKGGRASLVTIIFDQRFDEVQAVMPKVRAALTPTSLKAYLTGEPAVFDDIQNVTTRDVRSAETYTIPVAIFVLLLVFGTLVAACLPVVGGGVAVAVTLGIVYLLAHFFRMSVYTLSTTAMLGLAVGIDYSLLMVGRFREEIARGESVAAAVETTVARAGRSIFFSGVAVIVGLGGLMMMKFMALRSIGLGGSLVVLVSVAIALTLLPALLGMLGPRINALRVYRQHGREGRFWEAWSSWVMRHPVSLFVAVTIVILVLASPVVKIRTGVSGADILPAGAESKVGAQIIASRFNPAASSPIYLLLTWENGSSPFAPGNILGLYAYGQRLEKTPGVQSVLSIVNQAALKNAGPGALLGLGTLASGGSDPSADKLKGSMSADDFKSILALLNTAAQPGATVFNVVPVAAPNSQAAQDLATALEKLPVPPGMTAHVTGLAAGIRDFRNGLYGRLPWVIVFVLGVSYVVLLVVFRSVVLPLKAVIVNSISIIASFGAMVFIFQDGHFQGLLGFQSVGYVESTLPVILFCTLFGISMDYEVFMLTRMREEWLLTGDNRDAVAFGLAHTGRVITSAALIIVVVASMFAFTSIVITKALGVGLAIAVALDATVVRSLLVPATMRLLGGLNWWLPKRLERLLPRIGE